MISIPGLNDWAKEKSTNTRTPDAMTHNNSNSKRSLDDNDSEEMDCSEPATKKEKVSDNNDVDMDNAHCSTKVQNVLSEDHILNFPIPIDGGKACIVKVNYTKYTEYLKKRLQYDVHFSQLVLSWLLFRFMTGVS